MQKLATVAMAAMISVNASAEGLVGTGNDRIDAAREYMKAESSTDGSGIDWQAWGFWIGAVAGSSAVYSNPAYLYAICYPREATTGQLAEVAAKYLIDNPANRNLPVERLIWLAHIEAWGMQSKRDCHFHEKWKVEQRSARRLSETLSQSTD